MRFRQFYRKTSLLMVCVTLSLFTRAIALDIYSGEPLDEAFFDLSGAVLISHEVSRGTAQERVDVFRLADGRLIALSSASKKLGSPFTIKEIRVTKDNKSELSMKLAPITAFSEPPLPGKGITR